MEILIIVNRDNAGRPLIDYATVRSSPSDSPEETVKVAQMLKNFMEGKEEEA